MPSSEKPISRPRAQRCVAAKAAPPRNISVTFSGTGMTEPVRTRTPLSDTLTTKQSTTD